MVQVKDIVIIVLNVRMIVPREPYAKLTINAKTLIVAKKIYFALKENAVKMVDVL